MHFSRSCHYTPNAYRLPLAHCNGLSLLHCGLCLEQLTYTTTTVHPNFSGRELFTFIFVCVLIVAISWHSYFPYLQNFHRKNLLYIVQLFAP